MTGTDDRLIRAMGSTAHLVAIEPPTGLLDWAEAEIERLESLWSRFRPDSDLSRLNADAGHGPKAVHALTALAVHRALELHAATGGRFDPTILDSLEALGYDRTYAELREMSHDLGDPSRVGPAVGIAGVSVDLDAGTVDLPAGVRLDLGGVGKGLAADLVAEGLVDRGATGAAVGMGGDVRVAGRGPEDGAWNIDIEDPLDEGYMMATWALRDGAEAAVVTSTRMIRRWRHAGRDVHHLIDPATGRSADNELAAVVVAANEAWWAEGFAKAVLVAGTADGTLLLQRHNLHAMLVDTDGDTVEVRG